MSDLSGAIVAVSVSDAPDRAKLGFPAREIDRALLTLCTVLVRAGATISYAGNLDPAQYTFKIFRHLAGAYAVGRDPPPFLHLIPEPILRRSEFGPLHAALRENGAIARTRFSLPSGLVPVRASGDALLIGDQGAGRARISTSDGWSDWLSGHPVSEPAEAYTRARAAASAEAAARVTLGGKMGLLDVPGDRYEGSMAGIVEEAMMALEARSPLVPLGAFGGASRDVAIALRLLPADRKVPRGAQQEGYESGIARIAALAGRVPDALRPLLSAIADDDRSEATAYDIVKAIVAWRQAQDVGSPSI